jgi:hypothetical protein
MHATDYKPRQLKLRYLIIRPDVGILAPIYLQKHFVATPDVLPQSSLGPNSRDF